jgi:hypothetical protein
VSAYAQDSVCARPFRPSGLAGVLRAYTAPLLQTSAKLPSPNSLSSPRLLSLIGMRHTARSPGACDLCCVVLCSVFKCCFVLCCVVLCCVVFLSVVLCCVVLCCVLPLSVVLFCVVLCF